MTIYKTLENGVKIIEYEECFAAGLAEMWNQSMESWGGGDGLWTEQSQIDLYRNSAYYNVYLALAGEEIVGLCSLSRYYKDADALYIHVLNVRPDYMSQKVGKALVLQSVRRTIELGYPRLEIHTWAGNTKAVPVYKKCGYMWEDNSETTHLTNYLPTVISQELLKPFFDKADWYADSTRRIEIKPDGEKTNGFENFTYTWEKDGEHLAVTMEKTGRRICRVETDDYIIELAAENHALAYGFDYHAEIKTTNKSGKPLEVTMRGKDEGPISFNADKSLFTIGKTNTKQDPYRKHPCVLADVTVNGRELEMGVGIEIKPPLTASFEPGQGIAFTGKRATAYISLESSLLKHAKIEFKLPDNEYVRFDTPTQTVEINALGKACAGLTAEVLKTGHVKLDVPCEMTLSGDGEKRHFSMPLDIMSQGLTDRFSFSTETHYGIVNGPFCLLTDKENNNTSVNHALVFDKTLRAFPLFAISKLGKPYDDEFNLAVPTDVKAYDCGAEIIMELSYLSEKFADITMTMIYSLNAAGIVQRRHRIANAGNNNVTAYLSDTTFTAIRHSAAYRYDGRYTLSEDAGDEGLNTANVALFEENWVFENNPDYTIGVCWDPELKPSFNEHDGIALEHKLELGANSVAETPPVTVCIGIFKEYSAFRDYAMQTYTPHVSQAEDLLEIIVNSGNPFVSGNDFMVAIRNNRNKAYNGYVEAFPMSDGFFEQQAVQVSGVRGQGSEDEGREGSGVRGQVSGYEGNSAVFSMNVTPIKKDMEIGLVGIRTVLSSYLSEKSRVVFFPNGKVDCVDNDGVLEVSNGCLTFKADARYFAGLFSLQDKTGTEWLLSKHPSHEPYSWWNPFIGGMHNGQEKMDAPNTLKESMSAAFTKTKDNYGNTWQGIKTSVDVSLNKDYKGLSYETYYVTLPGTPVLCSFTRYENNTGGYLSTMVFENVFHNLGSPGDERIVDVAHKGKSFRFEIGGSVFETNKAEFVKAFTTSGTVLHWLPNLADRHSRASVFQDMRCLGCVRGHLLSVPDGAAFSTPPMFHVLANEELTPDALGALERLRFDKEPGQL